MEPKRNATSATARPGLTRQRWRSPSSFAKHQAYGRLPAAASGQVQGHWQATHDSHSPNHYSPKYDRRYVRISLIVQEAGRVSAQDIRLIDAFELSTVARFRATVPASKNLCLADDSVVDCQVAKDFISEHMRN